MYTSTFIFEAKPYDAEFHRLNDEAEVLSTYGQSGLGLAHIPEEA